MHIVGIVDRFELHSTWPPSEPTRPRLSGVSGASEFPVDPRRRQLNTVVDRIGSRQSLVSHSAGPAPNVWSSEYL